MKFGEIMWLAQGYTASQWQSCYSECRAIRLRNYFPLMTLTIVTISLHICIPKLHVCIP